MNKELSTEELLLPRKEVINDFPFNYPKDMKTGSINFSNKMFRVGDVLIFFEAIGEIGKPEYWYHHPITHQNFQSTWFDDFPNIFRDLQWWEKRDSLPMYIRFGAFDKQHTIYKVKSWGELGEGYKDLEPCGLAEKKEDYLISLRFPNNFPSTEEEYNQFLLTKNKV